VRSSSFLSSFRSATGLTIPLLTSQLISATGGLGGVPALPTNPTSAVSSLAPLGSSFHFHLIPHLSVSYLELPISSFAVTQILSNVTGIVAKLSTLPLLGPLLAPGLKKKSLLLTKELWLTFFSFVLHIQFKLCSLASSPLSSLSPEELFLRSQLFQSHLFPPLEDWEACS